MKNPTTRILLVAGAIALAAGIYINLYQPHTAVTVQTVATNGGAIGQEPYGLDGTHGKKVTEQSFSDKYKLVYFGFTNCPHVCPTSMGNITAALAALGDKANKIQPIFITVDPENDTIQVIKDYLYNFDKRFIGATGTAEEIKAAQQSFRVYANKTQGNAEHGDVMHSDYVYFLAPDGALLNVLPGETGGQNMADSLLPAL